MTDSEKLDAALAKLQILVDFVSNFGGPRVRPGDGSTPASPLNPVITSILGGNPLPQPTQPAQPVTPESPPVVNAGAATLEFRGGVHALWSGPTVFSLPIPAGWKGRIYVTVAESSEAPPKVDLIDCVAVNATGEALASMTSSSQPEIDFPVAVDQATTIRLFVTPHTSGGGMISVQLAPAP